MTRGGGRQTYNISKRVSRNGRKLEHNPCTGDAEWPRRPRKFLGWQSLQGEARECFPGFRRATRRSAKQPWPCCVGTRRFRPCPRVTVISRPSTLSACSTTPRSPHLSMAPSAAKSRPGRRGHTPPEGAQSKTRTSTGRRARVSHFGSPGRWMRTTRCAAPSKPMA